MNHLIIILFLLFAVPDIFAQAKIDGLTMVAPPEKFSKNPMPAVTEIHANWVAFVPYAFTRPKQAMVRFGNGQWWGETYAGIQKCVQMAHQDGLKVMIKPQVYIPGSWVGNMDFEQDTEWQKWEEDYREYIMRFVDLAIQEQVEMFCVGTEFKISVVKRESFWRNLIEDIRAKYQGQLIYSANWDSYELIPFWDVLDYIGVSAYFPLTDKKEPKTKTLLKKWRPIAKKLSKFSKRHQKKILFTEYGYLSVDGCADKCWLLEKKIKKLTINEQAQANALEALYTTFWFEEFWAGGFLWKWFPNMRGHEGYPEKDYTPQGKLGAQIVSKWYKKS